jgi:hypothetical protein
MHTGSEINVRVVPDPARAGELTGGEQLMERFADRVGELGASLGEIANELRSQLDASLTSDSGHAWRLDEICLTFSLDLEAQAGIVIAKAKTSAGFEASLTWKRLPAAT